MTHICVSKLTIFGSNNGLSPGQRQAIIYTNAGILLIRTLGTNFSEILSKIHAFSFKEMHFKMSSAKRRPFCLGLNVLRRFFLDILYTKYLTLPYFHDDVIKWKHFPRYWPFVRRIHRTPVNYPQKDHWRGALMFSLICTWITRWVNNPGAGDLRRHWAHCDVSVMVIAILPLSNPDTETCQYIICFAFNGGLVKPSLKSVHGRVNRSSCLCIYDYLSMTYTHRSFK